MFNGSPLDKRPLWYSNPVGEKTPVVDEWGNWFWTEEGTNPGFLYQQNSMRDAVSAGLNLNVFNKMSDRITQ